MDTRQTMFVVTYEVLVQRQDIIWAKDAEDAQTIIEDFEGRKVEKFVAHKQEDEDVQSITTEQSEEMDITESGERDDVLPEPEGDIYGSGDFPDTFGH